MPAPQMTTSAVLALTTTSEPLADPRVEHVAQAVTEDVHPKYGEGQEDSGEEDVVRENPEERAALGHDVAPRGRLGRDADAEEGQGRLDQDRRGGDEGRLRRRRAPRV